MSSLLRYAGLSDPPEGLTLAQEAELLALLTAAAELARWAGVAPDWADASALERAAWAAAGRRIEIQKARWTGLAAQGVRAAAAVGAELDQGEEHDELLLAEAMHSARVVALRGGTRAPR